LAYNYDIGEILLQSNLFFFHILWTLWKKWERPVYPRCDWPQPLTVAGAYADFTIES